MADKIVLWSTDEYSWEDGFDADADLEYLRDIAKDMPQSGIILKWGYLGRWCGPRCGHEYLKNMEDIFTFGKDEEDVEWFINEFGDLQCLAHHHDGTNEYTYKMVPGAWDEDEAEERLEAFMREDKGDFWDWEHDDCERIGVLFQPIFNY